MNIRRALFTGLATVGLVASFAAPVAMAVGEEAEVQVNEGGAFSNLHMWYGGVTFPAVTVTSQNPATATKADQYVDLTDTRASSPGWIIQIEASNLEADTTHVIDNKNLSLSFSHWGPNCSDPAVWTPSNAGNPSNPFQTVTNLVVGTQNLDSPVNLMNGTAGRGCNRLAGLYDFTLYVPSGTYTGGTAAVYTGDITLTNLAEMGS